MQKQHSQNIQELLDETNERLKKIESEYLQKIESAVCIICSYYYFLFVCLHITLIIFRNIFGQFFATTLVQCKHEIILIP